MTNVAKFYLKIIFTLNPLNLLTIGYQFYYLDVTPTDIKIPFYLHTVI